MANNPRAFDTRLREARQRAYLSVPTLAQHLPGVVELVVDLRFVLANGHPHSSPHKWIFLPDMQAYFDLMCPDRDCAGGGFDLGPAIHKAVRSRGRDAVGTLQCGGKVRGGERCGIALSYTIDARLND